MSKIKIYNIIVAACILTGCTTSKPKQWTAQHISTDNNFDAPECALYYQKTKTLYVSNIESSPSEYWSDDGKGGVYISYGWSNQVSFANMYLGVAEVRNATQQEWLESFFE